jgi:hypothetical protein
VNGLEHVPDDALSDPPEIRAMRHAAAILFLGGTPLTEAVLYAVWYALSPAERDEFGRILGEMATGELAGADVTGKDLFAMAQAARFNLRAGM